MRAKKILLTIALIFVAMFSLCGCASVQYLRTINGNGSIVDKLVISLDESKINKAGSTLTQVKSYINADFISFKEHIDSWKGYFDVGEYPELALRLETGITVHTTETQNELTFSVEFSDWQMFGLFYGIVTVDGQEFEKAMTDVGPFLSEMLLNEYGTGDLGIFLYKYSRVEDQGFIKNLQNVENDEYVDFTTLYNNYRALTNNHYDLSDIEISQVFTYPDTKLYGNADESEEYKGLNFMYWNLSDKGEDFKMEIYKVAPRVVPWYVVALVVATGVVVFLLFRIRKNAKNKVTVRVTKEEVERSGE